MEDYKQFAFTLLSVSAFYISDLSFRDKVWKQAKDDNDARDVRLLGGAFYCVKRSLKYKRQLDEMEES
ncbi:YrhC family protein [Bacillus licheniformis]|nr:YrhC family protein [Bacillus licheniformis]